MCYREEKKEKIDGNRQINMQIDFTEIVSQTETLIDF